MNVTRSERGFQQIILPEYAGNNEPKRLVSCSSAIGDYDDSFEKPGTSYLWIGDNHHLNREQVQELVTHLIAWLNTGKLDWAT